jgi:hypothetical protein
LVGVGAASTLYSTHEQHGDDQEDRDGGSIAELEVREPGPTAHRDVRGYRARRRGVVTRWIDYAITALS